MLRGSCTFLLLALFGSAALADEPVRGVYRGLAPVVKFDISPPLRDIKPLPIYSGPMLARPATSDPPSGLEWLFLPQQQGSDPLVQASVMGADIPSPTVSFNAQPNIAGVNPPDPVGDVGPNHYVAMSNSSFQIFSKNGTSLLGPSNINTIWSGFGGACQNENAGDPIVLHDQFADRWILTQFTAAGPTFFNCVAISQTPDPTGAYFRYAFSTGTNFPDYPKYGVWRDAYVISTREFAGAAFAGVGAYAINRAQVLAGNPAPTVVSFVVAPGAAPFNVGDGLLPADVDGPTLPPVGAPSYFVGSMDQGGPYSAPQDALTLWRFVIDFATPANSSFTLAQTIPVASFDSIFPCTGRQCIPQPGTAARVDILSYRQRPLHRLAYRNFGTHESLVTNQSVEAATNMAGIRWWEIRNPSGTAVIHQEGTYAPGVTDTVHRWMGSIAQDSAGNMALGYSASNGTDVFPSVRYTGRLASDPLGQMPQGEGVIVAGTGSNTGGGNRWGDYTSMNVDPTDDCTFWFVNQWTPTTSASGWRLRVGSFRFNECGTPSFTIGSSSTDIALCSGASSTLPINVASIAGFNSPVTLSATGLPANSSGTLNPNPVTPLPGQSQFTLNTTTALATGIYPFTIDATAAGPITRTINMNLNAVAAVPVASTLTVPANNAINVATGVTFTWAASPTAADYTVQLATDSGFTNIVRSTTTTTTSWTPSPALNSSTQYFWRVFARNACSVGSPAELFADGFEDLVPNLGTVSATSSFTTSSAPGDCPAGPAPTIVLSENFDGTLGAGWGQQAGGSGTNTWAVTGAFPFGGSGQSLRATAPTTVSDQRYVSPAIALPTVGNGLTLTFQSRHAIEVNTAGTICYDGGILEVSTNGGTSYTQVPNAQLQTDPYNANVDAGFSSPIAGLPAWCGTQAFTRNVVDLTPYAGQTAQFRFRLASDSSANLPEGWIIDNVEVKRCN